MCHVLKAVQIGSDCIGRSMYIKVPIQLMSHRDPLHTPVTCLVTKMCKYTFLVI